MKQFTRKYLKSLSALCIVMFVSMMTGCSKSMPPLPARPPIPASLIQPCQQLTPLTDTNGEALIEKLIEVGQKYNDCADSKQALINAVS